jgi:tRNA (guanine-N7-)-methyltransferase
VLVGGVETLRRRHDFFSVIELIPESCIARLDPQKIFGRAARLHVDLGCGDGAFLFALATRMPEKNFLGVERLASRVEKASRKAHKIDNMCVLRFETAYAVKYLLSERSVETFHLLFPDPWPKRRHHRRRIVTKDFLRAIWAALEENGVLRIVTDHFDYFTRISQLAEGSSLFAFMQPSRENDFPASAFEKKFASTGARIYRLELRKISPVM